MSYFFKCHLVAWSWICMILLCCIPLSSFSQKTIHGIVKDSTTGEVLIGATILLQDTKTGVITDIDGKFSMEVPDGKNVLNVSYLGYRSLLIGLNDRDTIEVNLPLGEVITCIVDDLPVHKQVFIGYGRQISKNISSAVTSLLTNDLNKGFFTSPYQLIQAKVPGLIIAKPSGDPNGEYDIRLRGLTSILSNNAPLIVMDGIPGMNINNINPNDIGSIDVLRDGSAAAIYGVRASGGVIIITSRQRINDQDHMEYSSSINVESLVQQPSNMNAAVYKRIGGKDLGSATDWIDAITRTALQQQHQLSLSGGTNNMDYRASMSYRDVPGILLHTGFKQLDGSVHLNQKSLNKKLTIGLDLYSKNRNQEIGFKDAFRYAMAYNPTAPILDPSNVRYGGYFNPSAFDLYNPVALIEQNHATGVINYITGSIRGEYEIIKGLKYRIHYNVSHDQGGNEQGITESYFSKQSAYTPYHLPSTYRYDPGKPYNNQSGLASRYATGIKMEYLSSTINYETSLNRIHFNALAGYDFQKFVHDGSSVSGGDFITDQFGANNLGASLDFPNGYGTVESYKTSNKLIAFFGRFNANIDNTWYASISMRKEGSSRFGINHKWGLFPAVSAGVELSNLIDISFMDHLKFRIGYGSTGNDLFRDYLSLHQLGPVGYSFNNGTYSPAYGSINNPNPELKWEQKKEINAGIDFGIFHHKITGSLDYYHRKSTDLIYPFYVSSPSYIANNIWVNTGVLSSDGLETSITVHDLNIGDFNWTSSLNASFYSPIRLESLSKDNFKFGNNGIITLGDVGSPGFCCIQMIQVEEGRPLGQIYAPTFNGVDASGRPTLIDANGDGHSGSDDNILQGNGLPSISLGVYNEFKYKRFSLGFLFRGLFGHSLVNQFRLFYESRNPNAIPSYNRINTRLTNPEIKDNVYSSLYVEKGNYLKLDNFHFDYQVALKHIGHQLVLSLSANNVLTLTNYTGLDPEVRMRDEFAGGIQNLAPGIDRRNIYFNTKSYSFSIRLTL